MKQRIKLLEMNIYLQQSKQCQVRMRRSDRPFPSLNVPLNNLHVTKK